MLLRTKRNGGNASLQEVAETWKKESHDFGWSDAETDKWTVEFTKKIKAELQDAGPANIDPRNIHKG